jgi:hypothetical protein
MRAVAMVTSQTLFPFTVIASSAILLEPRPAKLGLFLSLIVLKNGPRPPGHSEMEKDCLILKRASASRPWSGATTTLTCLSMAS